MKKSYDAEQFADRLKQLREIRGITSAALADALGITHQSLSLYENAKRTPNAIVLHDIAVYFDVTSDFLLGISGEKNESEKIYAAQKYTGLSCETVMALNKAKDDDSAGRILRMEAIKCILEDFEHNEQIKQRQRD